MFLEGKNIEATQPGINLTSDGAYIICAHYDSVEGSPGADDDGSGVTAVLCAAEIMSKYTFNHDIRFVTFSGEEQGLVGSAYYVEELGENTFAAFNADMIGYAESDYDRDRVNIWSDSNSRVIYEIAEEVGEEYYDYIGLEVIDAGYKGRSDHYRFWEFGYPGIFFQEYLFNEYYHSPQDTIENMDITYATRVIKLMIATLAEFAEPNNYPNTPIKPIGLSNGKPGNEYNFTTISSDPDSDQIYYKWDWGDDNFSEWLGPFDSNVTCEAFYSWEQEDIYNISVKVKDINGAESNWSEPLTFSTPKNKSLSNFNQWFIRFIERYSILEFLL
jgi:hypothetical protein